MNKKNKKLSQQLKTQPSYFYEHLIFFLTAQVGFEIPPLSYAIGTLLLEQDYETIKSIYQYLDSQLDGIQDDPHNQPDLRNKTFMLVIYQFICDEKGFQSHLSPTITGKYIDYSQKEQWFDSLELALFVKKFAVGFRDTDEINDFAKKKLPESLEKKRVDTCAQCIEILEGKIAISDKLKFIELIQEWNFSQVSSPELAWGVIGLMRLNKEGVDIAQQDTLEENTENIISEITLKLKRDVLSTEFEFQMINIFNKFKNQSSNGEFTTLNFDSRSLIEKVDFNENTITLQTNGNIVFNPISPNILALSIWAFTLAGCNQIYGVSQNKRDELLKLVITAENIGRRKKIFISRSTNYLVNFMGLLLILLIGCGISLYNSSVLNFDFTKFQLSFSFLISVIPTIFIFVIGVISLIKRGTIVLSILEIPYLGKLWKTITEKAKE